MERFLSYGLRHKLLNDAPRRLRFGTAIAASPSRNRPRRFAHSRCLAVIDPPKADAMSKIPAFPSESTKERRQGMSLREWYAGLAMQGIVASVGEGVVTATSATTDQVTEQIATQAFAIADAMMSVTGGDGF